MANKKQYYGLDEIGFVGTQDKSKAQVKKDIERTVAYFKAKKIMKGTAVSQKSSKTK